MELEEAKSFEFEDNGDRLGWTEGSGKHHYTLFIQNGRIKDTEDFKLKTAIKELAKVHKGDFRMTPNQNLIIANVDEKDKPEIQKIIDNYGLTDGKIIVDCAVILWLVSLSRLVV